jgi:DNA polymerase-1
MKHFGGGEAGKEACRAIGALANIGQIDSTITNFLEPLQVGSIFTHIRGIKYF